MSDLDHDAFRHLLHDSNSHHPRGFYKMNNTRRYSFQAITSVEGVRLGPAIDDVCVFGGKIWFFHLQPQLRPPWQCGDSRQGG